MHTAAVTEKAANSSVKLFPSALKNLKSLFLSPKAFVSKPTFIFVCVVYGGTYITANVVNTLCEFSNVNPALYKLGFTSAVNMTLGVMKDKYFAQVFSGKPVTKFPLSSWSIFIFRDVFTIGAGFTLPGMTSKYIQESKLVSSPSLADKVCQVAVPMSAQLLLTPVHLLALDFYNNKVSTLPQRFNTIKSIFPETTSIRMGRVLFAYGIAGVANTSFKNFLKTEYL
jgi:hypothetical protein